MKSQIWNEQNPLVHLMMQRHYSIYDVASIAGLEFGAVEAMMVGDGYSFTIEEAIRLRDSLFEDWSLDTLGRRLVGTASGEKVTR